jgi:preprotein translocase subunit SecD
MKSYFLYPLALGILCWGSIPTYGQNSAARTKTAEPEFFCPDFDGNKVRPPKMRGLYFGRALFRPSDVASVTSGVDNYSNYPIVNLTFSAQAAKRFGNLTATNVGKTMPIFLDGTLLSCPVINEAILGGQVQISGQESAIESAKLALKIKRYAG